MTVNKIIPKRREICLDSPRFLETDVLPTVGDIIFVGCRRELVVGDVPENTEHGHLIRTAYKENGKLIENTYQTEWRERACHTLSHLGSSEGVFTSSKYDKTLKEAGF